jgi:putative MFS transporter
VQLERARAAPGFDWDRPPAPIVVGWMMSSMDIQYVFTAFATIRVLSAVVTMFFAVETKGRVLEELSP